MRYAIILLISAGSLGCALPQAATEQTLPFQPAPEGSGRACPEFNGGYDEGECGTKRFCTAIGVFGADSTKFKTKPAWNSTADCFKAHAPAPKQALLPFDFGAPVDPDCTVDGLNEHSCGTKFYCDQIDDIQAFAKLDGEDTEQTEDVRYASTEECFKAHAPEPKNLPWLEADEENFCGSRGDYSEENCGTQSFCDARVGEDRQAWGSLYIWNTKQCFAAHQKEPYFHHLPGQLV